jgi:hypothetical protein
MNPITKFKEILFQKIYYFIKSKINQKNVESKKIYQF